MKGYTEFGLAEVDCCTAVHLVVSIYAGALHQVLTPWKLGYHRERSPYVAITEWAYRFLHPDAVRDRLEGDRDSSILALDGVATGINPY